MDTLQRLQFVTDDGVKLARPEVLAAAIPGARLENVSGGHGTCITNPRFAEAVLNFTNGHSTP